METSERNVLLIGGTGAMGIYLIPELVRMGFSCTVTSRSDRKSDNSKVTYIKGNGHNLAFLKSLANEMEFVAVVDFMHYTTKEFGDRVDRLVRLSNQYLFLSSYRVFANEDSVITEESPRLLDVVRDKAYLASDEYALAKARQEDMLRSRVGNWTILRPSITYSKNRFQLGVLEANLTVSRAVRGLPTVIARDLLDKETTMTWAGDVARMIARLVANEKAYGEDFNVATSEHHPWSEVAALYSEYVGLRSHPIGLKDYIAVTRRKWQITYDRMFNRVLDNSKALEFTGLGQSELSTLREGLHRELDGVDKGKYLSLDRNWEIEAHLDFLTDSRIGLESIPQEHRESYQESLRVLRRPENLLRTRADTQRPTLQISSPFWRVRELPWNEFAEFVRILSNTLGRPAKGENRLINYRVDPAIARGAHYSLSIRLMSSVDATFQPFLHGQARIQKLGEWPLIANHWTVVTCDFVGEYDGLSWLGISSTDFPIAGSVLAIESITFSRKDLGN